jgi:hypothetical protein
MKEGASMCFFVFSETFRTAAHHNDADRRTDSRATFCARAHIAFMHHACVSDLFCKEDRRILKHVKAYAWVSNGVDLCFRSVGN